jgi:hypothetical protein
MRRLYYGQREFDACNQSTGPFPPGALLLA